MRKIDLTKRAAEFLKQLPPKQCKQNFMAILKLAVNPMPHDASQLRGYDRLYRIDVGEYRVIYQFNQETVSILLVGKRNDDEIYDELKRVSKTIKEMYEC